MNLPKSMVHGLKKYVLKIDLKKDTMSNDRVES